MRKSVYLIIIAIVLTTIAPFLTVKAEDFKRIDISCIEDYSSGSKFFNKADIVTDLNKIIADFAFFDNEKFLYLDGDIIKNISNSAEKKKVVNSLIKAVSEMDIHVYKDSKITIEGIKNEITNSILNMVNEVSSASDLLNRDTTKEVNEAVSWWNTVSKYINPVIAFFTIGVVVLFVLSFISDIAFLESEYAKQVLSFGNLDRKPKLISKAAYNTYLKAINEELSGSIIVSYVWKNKVHIVITGILIRALVGGKLYSFIDTIAKFFEGF